ncbi:acetyl-CoA carboxylase, biotin carboxyl carrier protein [Desulfurobacterium thermolithotrophum DSM 11699]|uniref:Biotin carboxyl carrier protein of acetyl-CoA carboxylase n=1 Tax=Desulfurobacterium thermolithotrophum (strain DSM 11699 / BSA) TaxID=868864 RepID=F0S0I7_DESTD|nr:acetyl-CoA carboxylase biotin carboxyl carrier protein [Desulfurobacterium thermolithotrophum]ADY72715.1 acetyl-CoA carboxylase, biotin carboxyl carrier protein [Desulfurobacterium thermolithotrophum DSM 11699]
MLDKVRELLKALENTSIEEVEIEVEGIKLRAKFARGVVKEIPLQEVVPKEIKKEEKEEITKNTEDYYVVESPMVGTFYRAPAPGAEPFVKEGDFVEKGQTLCIIEALKVMNEIEAEVSGVVKKILVENGQPVEYGQPLFYIEKA